MEIIRDISTFKHILPVIATPEYFCVLGARDYGYIKDGQYILPFYIKRKYIFNYLIFTTGVLGKIDSAQKNENFLNNVILYLKAKKIADFILMNHVTALFDVVPIGCKFCTFGSYVLDLNLSEDELFAALHTKHRNVIRKAQKDGIVIKEGKAYKSECIKLVCDTLKRQGITPPSADYYSRIGDSLKKYCDYWIALDINGNPQGSAILVWSEGSFAYYLFGGSCKNPHTGAINLLQWEAILKMKERGVLKYDFVGARISPEAGSKYEGIQRFKSRFGGELIQGYLWKMSLNNIKYNLYVFMVSIRNILRGRRIKDIIDQECEKNG